MRDAYELSFRLFLLFFLFVLPHVCDGPASPRSALISGLLPAQELEWGTEGLP